MGLCWADGGCIMVTHHGPDDVCVQGETLSSAAGLGLAPALPALCAGNVLEGFFPQSSQRNGVRGLIRSVCLYSTIKVDDFTARLFRIHVQVLEEGLAQVQWRSPSSPQPCPSALPALSASLLLRAANVP